MRKRQKIFVYAKIVQSRDAKDLIVAIAKSEWKKTWKYTRYFAVTFLGSPEHKLREDNNVMSEEFKRRAGKFIAEYFDKEPKASYEDERIIKEGIRILIHDNVFTKKELQKETMKKYNILITSTLLEECLY